jgi:hypothetical protein
MTIAVWGLIGAAIVLGAIVCWVVGSAVTADIDCWCWSRSLCRKGSGES